jgi:hypothetical protein
MRPNRLPSPMDLIDDPERAILAALDVTLEIAQNSLMAAHPELFAEEFPDRACEEALAADRLIGLIQEMQGTIASYKRWLRDLTQPAREKDPAF